MTRLTKHIVIAVIAIIVVLGGVFGFHFFVQMQIKKYIAHFQPPPPSVTVAKAKAQHWQPTIEVVGNLRATEGVDISPRTAGIISTIDFKSGQLVKKGQLLVELNKDVLVAQLKNSIANLKLAQINFKREDALYKKKVGAESALDTARARLLEAQAELEQVQAQLSEKEVVAPFSGKLGIRQVNLGQYIQPGTDIVTLQKLDPIEVIFNIPATLIQQVTVGQTLRISDTESHHQQFYTGKVFAIDPKVDNTTRSILVEGILPNTKHLLYPGKFVDISVLLPKIEQVIVIPQTAITYTLYGDSVFVVHKKILQDGKVSYQVTRRLVHLGERRGDEVAVLEGLHAGEMVVSAGQMQLQNKQTVKIKKSIDS